MSLGFHKIFSPDIGKHHIGETVVAKNIYDKTHTKYVGKIRAITNRNEIIRQWIIKGNFVAAIDLFKKQIRELSSLRKKYESHFATYRLRERSKRRTARKKK